MAAPSSRYAPLIDNARRVLEANRLRGTSHWEGRKYDFVCPSVDTYPFQWLWDSAFHAVCLLHLDAALAKQEIRCLLQGIQPDGFMPHILLWDTTGREAQLQQYDIVLSTPFTTATTQPPVLARAIERVYDATKDKKFLAEALPPVLRWFDWLARNRDPDDDGLLAIIQPDESGLDVSPKFDLPMGMSGRASLVYQDHREAMTRLAERYDELRTDQAEMLQLDAFQVEEVMFNTVYGDGLRSLARLCKAAPKLDDDLPDADELERRAVKVTTGLLLKAWDEESGVFWDLWGQDEKPLRVLTITALFPLILEDLPPDVALRLVKDHLLDPAEFWTRFPVPTVAVDEPSFDPAFRTQAIWRGPAWANTNWFLYWGLVRHGYSEIATELANRTFDMVLRGGPREFFNPLTAEGYGANDFSWTSLVLDLLAAEGLLASNDS